MPRASLLGCAALPRDAGQTAHRATDQPRHAELQQPMNVNSIIRNETRLVADCLLRSLSWAGLEARRVGGHQRPPILASCACQPCYLPQPRPRRHAETERQLWRLPGAPDDEITLMSGLICHGIPNCASAHSHVRTCCDRGNILHCGLSSRQSAIRASWLSHTWGNRSLAPLCFRARANAPPPDRIMSPECAAKRAKAVTRWEWQLPHPAIRCC